MFVIATSCKIILYLVSFFFFFSSNPIVVHVINFYTILELLKTEFVEKMKLSIWYVLFKWKHLGVYNETSSFTLSCKHSNVHEKYEILNLLKKNFFSISFSFCVRFPSHRYSKIFQNSLLYFMYFFLSILCLYFGGREFRMDCYKNNKFIDRVIEFRLRKRIKLKHEW